MKFPFPLFPLLLLLFPINKSNNVESPTTKKLLAPPVYNPPTNTNVTGTYVVFEAAAEASFDEGPISFLLLPSLVDG